MRFNFGHPLISFQRLAGKTLLGVVVLGCAGSPPAHVAMCSTTVDASGVQDAPRLTDFRMPLPFMVSML